jgi:hypothetical protein
MLAHHRQCKHGWLRFVDYHEAELCIFSSQLQKEGSCFELVLCKHQEYHTVCTEPVLSHRCKPVMMVGREMNSNRLATRLEDRFVLLRDVLGDRWGKTEELGDESARMEIYKRLQPNEYGLDTHIACS